jgi:hypothetical protein
MFQAVHGYEHERLEGINIVTILGIPVADCDIQPMQCGIFSLFADFTSP